MWNSCAVTVPVAVTLTKVGDALVFKSWFINAPLASLLSILVEKELDAVVNELAEASFRVTLVEKEDEALVNELPLASFRVTRVENEPLSVFNAVTLVLNEPLSV